MSISQPAVSRLVRDLEAEIGFNLFFREGIRTILTEQGRQLYREVARHLVSSDHIAAAAQAIRNNSTNQLYIGSIMTLAEVMLPIAVVRILSLVSDASIAIHQESAANIVEMVVSGTLDVAIVTTESHIPGLICETVISAEAICLLPDQHPLAAKPVIDIHDLDGVTLVLQPRSSIIRNEIDLILKNTGTVVKSRLEAHATTFPRYVSENLGVAICGPFGLLDTSIRGFVARKFYPKIETNLYLIYKNSATLPHFFNLFREILKETIETEVGKLRSSFDAPA